MLWSQLILVILAGFLISALEIRFEYPDRYPIVYQSRHFVSLFIFNFLVAIIIFLANMELNFIDISNSSILALLIGISGFLLFNSKIDIDSKNKLLGFKSFASREKTKLFCKTSEFLEKEYRLKLALFISDNFVSDSEFFKDYIGFIRNIISTEPDNKKKSRLTKRINNISVIANQPKKEKIFLLTMELFKFDDSYWIKKEILNRFCGK